MPEPEAAATTTSEVAVPPTPPIETSSSRASFASCPPEEERETRAAARIARADTPLPDSPEASSAIDDDGDARIVDVRQEPTPEPDARLGARRDGEEEVDKALHVEDAMIGAEGDGRSAVGSPIVQTEDVSEGGSRRPEEVAAQARSAEERAGEESAPIYMSYPSTERQKPHPQAWSSFLHPGSKFRGTQQSDRQVYDVQVEIKDVDLTESRLCGYLRIQGLTDDHPTLTTFFEGEVIGPKHLFRTTHPSWNSSEKIDLQHWARFPAFRPLAKSARSSPSTFTLKDYLERDHLFMRWKEYFLVPDHRVKSISGASFEGFYYICFDQLGGGVSGIYFHAKSEKYQQLELRHVDSGGCMAAVEFR